ncbi:conserved exported hypothetical protein [Verrucomicrobia bacterium]|nr:conserved exported hypothetical protein [Verrucomicrobiota bacterium]
MTKHVTTLILGLAASLGGFNAVADLEVSASFSINAVADFYHPLTPYGAWVRVGSYGRCWHPAEVGATWRPYCDGNWEWTDAGWYWNSDQPWAWACYHYGTWVDDPTYGWCWVPGTQWAPAWVDWRQGGDYIGWAPLPPPGVRVSPALFAFVDLHRFTEPLRFSSLIINDPRIISETREIRGTRREMRNIGGAERSVVINEGPGVDPIQRATGRRFTATPIQRVIERTPMPQGLRQESPRPTPTGRENPRLFEQQPNAPAGREQPRVRPEQPRPAPEQPRNAPERERPPQSRSPNPVPPPERGIAPPERANPPERPVLPPTGRPNERPATAEGSVPAPELPNRPKAPPLPAGRERPNETPSTGERAAPAPVRPQPATPPERPPKQEEQRPRDHDKPGAI